MKYSAGIIPFRINEETNEIEFFVGHPGGKYWKYKDFWMFLKGCVEKEESWQDAAIREFKEETGLTMEDCESQMLIPLGSVQQNQDKTVIAYALHYPNINPDVCKSNLCEDGITPEIDKYKWIPMSQLKHITHNAHLGFYDKIIKMVEENND